MSTVTKTGAGSRRVRRFVGSIALAAVFVTGSAVAEAATPTRVPAPATQNVVGLK